MTPDLPTRLRALAGTLRAPSPETLSLLEEVAEALTPSPACPDPDLTPERVHRIGSRYAPSEAFKADVAAAFEEANRLRQENARLRGALEGATADMLTAGRQIEVDMGSLCAVMDVDEEPVSRTIENAQFLRSQAVLARVVLAEAEGGEK